MSISLDDSNVWLQMKRGKLLKNKLSKKDPKDHKMKGRGDQEIGGTKLSLILYDVFPPQDDKCNGDLSSSSSKMISFEFSNGNPYGPHVPATLDDDQYVEYELDDLTGFPSSAEEEERVSCLSAFT